MPRQSRLAHGWVITRDAVVVDLSLNVYCGELDTNQSNISIGGTTITVINIARDLLT